MPQQVQGLERPVWRSTGSEAHLRRVAPASGRIPVALAGRRIAVPETRELDAPLLTKTRVGSFTTVGRAQR